METELLLLPSFKTCYFCGTGNPHGMRIRYHYDPRADRITGSAEPDARHCGYPGVLHGGIQSALLDDVMYWAASYRTATSSVTVELSCRYRKTAPLGEVLFLEARAAEPEGRKIRAAGELRDREGQLLAEADALYLLHPREQFVSTMLPFFDFRGCCADVVEHFTRPPEDSARLPPRP